MSFSAREPSFNDGEPQELYWFMRGATAWFYTSGAFPVTLGLNTYEPLAGLKRGEIRRGRERSKNSLTVDMPRDTDIISEFIQIPQQTPIWLHVYRIHEGESDYRIMWQGRVRSVDFRGEKAVLTLDDLLSSAKKNAFRALYQGQCNNFTFDANCGLNEDDFRFDDVPVGAVDDAVIEVDNAEPAGWFIAGQVRRANGERRMIMADSKTGSTHTLTLLQPFEGLEVGEEVRLIGGACRHTFATCQDVSVKTGADPVDNSENYGGYPMVPRKNPFKSVI